MRRRELIVDVAVTAILWPYTVRGQQNALPTIGFLSARSLEDSKAPVAAFRQGLAEMGFVEGENLAIEYRWARGDTNGCLVLPRSWSASRYASSRPSVVSPRLWRQRLQPRRSRSSFPWASPYSSALSRVTTGRGETSRASMSWRRSWKPSGPASCMILCRKIGRAHV